MLLDKKQERPKYYVPALEKGLDVLEELAASSTPQSLTHLAQNLCRTPNEIYRTLCSLERRGYIRREEHSGNYRLSLKLYELAHQRPPEQVLITAATQPMEKLATSLLESCHLGVLRRGELVVLQQALSPSWVRLSVEIGSRHSAVHTTSGRLLLAQMTEDELAKFLSDHQDYQALSQTEQAEFTAKLVRIRQQGYSMSEHVFHIGVRDYAVLVGNPKIRVFAALAVASLTAVKGPTDSERILRELQETARTITNELGIQYESEPNPP